MTPTKKTVKDFAEGVFLPDGCILAQAMAILLAKQGDDVAITESNRCAILERFQDNIFCDGDLMNQIEANARESVEGYADYERLTKEEKQALIDSRTNEESYDIICETLEALDILPKF